MMLFSAITPVVAKADYKNDALPCFIVRMAHLPSSTVVVISVANRMAVALALALAIAMNVISHLLWS